MYTITSIKKQIKTVQWRKIEYFLIHLLENLNVWTIYTLVVQYLMYMNI